MSSQEAQAQMLGYLYQVRCALMLLIESATPSLKLVIEKFDDVSFENDSNPVAMVQLKHHIGRAGNLTDRSPDLWRTIKIWVDAVEDNPVLLEKSRFVIITTAKAPQDSIASLLKMGDDGRDAEKAFIGLRKVASSQTSEINASSYKAFIALNEDRARLLVNSIYVFDEESNIFECKSRIKRLLRFSCQPKYEDILFERLEGWWCNKCISLLSNKSLDGVTQSDLRYEIVKITNEFRDDNLPIDVEFDDIDEKAEKEHSAELFCKQLGLISCKRRRIIGAIEDFCKASSQRAKWIDNCLVVPDELEHYEERLIDEWSHEWSAMSDELGDESGEAEKQKEGRQLLTEIMRKDVRIRQGRDEPFVMRGTYHILANSLKIGWHIDYLQLCSEEVEKNEIMG